MSQSAVARADREALAPSHPVVHPGSVEIETLRNSNLGLAKSASQYRLAELPKRSLDLMVVLLLLPLAIPLIAVIALLIRIDSSGPALFVQKRPGRHGRPFLIFKFRTMHMDAERRFHLLPASVKEEFCRHGKIRNDPRVTRVGRFLRKSSLDELPQLWNVLIGDMSLVGPRAFLENQMDQVHNRHIILSTRPGITGLWQVSGRSDVSFDRRLELDQSYVTNWSLGLDLMILVRTVHVVLFGQGAY